MRDLLVSAVNAAHILFSVVAANCIKMAVPSSTINHCCLIHQHHLLVSSSTFLLCHDSMGRRPLMGGNWKLNPKSVAGATSLAADLAKLIAGVKDVDVCVFPAHPHLAPVQVPLYSHNPSHQSTFSTLSTILLSGQDQGHECCVGRPELLLHE